MRTSINIAEAKRDFSQLVSRVAFGGETILITRRGKPMARLVPTTADQPRTLTEVPGWLENDDPFFDLIDEIVEERDTHVPRTMHLGRPSD